MQLHCGNLNFQYENGFLRYIKAGNVEVIRMIYFALRDQNWGTIPGKISNEKIEQFENHFVVSYEMVFEKREINMHWTATIRGNNDNNVTFEIKGKALDTFKKNRAGFCVLHPIKECVGKKVIIQQADGSRKECRFPDYISPHQPFKNISAMSWEANKNCKVSLQFEGDIFETEDQRNWTDNSFKTYCTPLDVPFPATMNKGEEVIQKISLSVVAASILEEQIIPISITASEEIISIPAIGIGRSSERNEHYLKALELLSSIGFSHYRIDIRLDDPDWQSIFNEAVVESERLQAPLEIGLFVNDESLNTLEVFILRMAKSSIIKQIALLPANGKCISSAMFRQIHSRLVSRLPKVLIGAGTDHNFTDLNRSDLNVKKADFVQYSINPQAHAIDNRTLIENMEGQAYTVQTARHRFKKPVHVSPVTLKMRKNPDAVEPTGTHEVPFDERQQTNFTAGWTLGSLKYLIESGASSVTYYEATGKRGIVSDDDSLNAYPLLKVFKNVCSKDIVHARKTKLSHPLSCSALIVGNRQTEFIILANHENKPIEVEIQNLSSKKIMIHLNANEIALYRFNF